MSYTNKTTHYELPQYVATDKPKYLTDFNETMATIDGQMYTNSTAAATAQSAAEGAQSTADGAVSSIGTLNTQINGDPTDPSDTGLAGDVSDLDGNVNTIQALLGNGTPTTSNQTVIGAINAIEGAIAPAEDSATLGANYVTGAQFARGGVVYEALVDLTSGTAFTSLVLNTDYKVADRLVKQIDDVAADTQILRQLAVNGYKIAIEDYAIATVTADGVKTRQTLLNELSVAFLTEANQLSANAFFEVKALSISNYGDMRSRSDVVIGRTATAFTKEFLLSYCNPTTPEIENTVCLISEALAVNSWKSVKVYDDAGTLKIAGFNGDSDVIASGVTFKILGNKWYKDVIS